MDIEQIENFEEKIELSNEQQLLILKYWNDNPEPLLKEIVNLVFPGKDVRSKHGICVRKFLVSRKLKCKSSQPEKKPDINLSDEQQEFITNNCDKMTAAEITKILFPDCRISGLCKELIAVKRFIDQLANTIKNREENEKSPEDTLLEEETKSSGPTEIYQDNTVSSEYVPPKNHAQAIRKINKYTNFGIDPAKLNQKQKKEIMMLINYMHCHHFTSQINSYTRKDDRDLFESTFVRCTYDKSDLSNEEINQYINYATDVVLGKGILEDIEEYKAIMRNEMDENHKINQNTVEAIKVLRDDLDRCSKRQNDVLKRLTGTRNEKMATKISQNQSLVHLVEAFKNEETRKKYLKFAELRKEALKNDMERLENLDSLIWETFGVDKNELLNS